MRPRARLAAVAASLASTENGILRLGIMRGLREYNVGHLIVRSELSISVTHGIAETH